MSALTSFGLFLKIYHKDNLIGFSGLTQTVHSLNCDEVNSLFVTVNTRVSCLMFVS